MGKLDVQGWIRTAVMIGAIAGGYYYSQGRLDAHLSNKEIHKSTAELSDMFVLRREWESNHYTLKDDVKYLRNKIDAIYDKVSDTPTSGGRR